MQRTNEVFELICEESRSAVLISDCSKVATSEPLVLSEDEDILQNKRLYDIVYHRCYEGESQDLSKPSTNRKCIHLYLKNYLLCHMQQFHQAGNTKH